MFFSKIRGFFLFSCLMLFSLSHAQAEKIPEVPGVKLSPEKLDLARQIRALFPDAPIMVRVAMCESGLIHRKDGELIRNQEGSSAKGTFQVLMRVHAPQMYKMGLNPERTDDYLAYVRFLFDRYGFTPWQSSQHCWNRNSTPPRG